MGLPSATFADFRSPGLAHVGGGEDFDYTLGNLHQLRYKTFGGSQISLNSSQGGSPRSERAAVHSDRFETSSPTPWDVNRPISHLGVGAALPPPHERYISIWNHPDSSGSATITGFPPQPLNSPPPVPQHVCTPVLEEEAESPGVRTVKSVPDMSESELSPAGTFGDGVASTPRRSLDSAVERSSLLDFEDTVAERNAAAFGANAGIVWGKGTNSLVLAPGAELLDGATDNSLLRGPRVTDDASTARA